jgi:dephospho-CoA kinase
MLIAVTGGMGGGKSLLGEILKDRAEVYDADVIARRLQRVGGAAYRPLLEAFGGEYFMPELDRARLGRAVFSDSALLDKLNGVMHPLIKKEIEKIRVRGGGAAFVSVPLLFESGFINCFDAVWLITSDEAIRKKRAAARDPRLSPAEIDARFAAQLSESARIDCYNRLAPLVKFSSFNRIIENDGTAGQFRERVLSAFDGLFLK